MANVLRVTLDLKGSDQGQNSRDPTANSKLVQTQSENWLVVMDGYVAGLAAAAVPGLPTVGGIYNGMFCTRVNPVRDPGSPNVWRVRVDYATINQPNDSQSGNWNIKCKIDPIARTETLTQDGVGKAYWNAADRFLPQLPNDTVYDDQIAISYATKNPPPWAGQRYSGLFNSDAVTFTIGGIRMSYAKFQLRATLSLDMDRTLTGYSGLRPTYRTTYNCQITFQARFPDWIWRAPNEGFEGLNPDDDQIYLLSNDPSDRFNTKLTPSSVPLKLDDDGSPLEDDSVLWLPDDFKDDSRYSDEGRFLPAAAVAFMPLLVGLSDDEQLAPPST